MALSQLVVQSPGTLIKSGDWNNEFQNILTKPITLISPTTGAINFNLQSHSNLLPNVITASSGSAGQALVVSGGATVWGNPTVQASGVTIVAGSTGQVFAVTSSNSAPAFQTLPIDGGLSTFTPTAGMVYTISSSAGLLRGITIGTSGQVLMVATSGLPTWQNMTTGGSGTGGSGGLASTSITWFDDFIFCTTAVGGAATGINARSRLGGYNNKDGTDPNTPTASTYANGAGGGVYFPPVAQVPFQFTRGTSTAGATGPDFIWTTTMNPVLTFILAVKTTTATNTGVRMGLSNLMTSAAPDPTNGLYLRTSGAVGSTNYQFVSRVGGTEFKINSGVVISSQPHVFTFTVANGATNPTCAVSVDGAAVGTFTSSQVPTSTMGIAMMSTNGASDGVLMAWQVTADRSTGAV